MKRRFCGGFTLLEVLVVVVIAVLVVVAAVPAYKKTQEKNRYMAAQGVLMDLANGVRMVKAEYPSLTTNAIQVTGNDASSDPDPTSNNLVGWMMSNKYISQIEFDNQAYMRYKFSISTNENANCNQTGISCEHTGAVACMSGSNEIAEYTCAWVDNQGDLHNN